MSLVLCIAVLGVSCLKLMENLNERLHLKSDSEHVGTTKEFFREAV